ncbi:MAG: hypothetical protein CMB09_02935 [Euryarchaeota archaeon]|nr:hypothetical protein [Euryarchaeota archaeon]|tara:strand:+ start:3204 stop:3923 length:720 start_codon:yes stop_codon:yes gene_type:complete
MKHFKLVQTIGTLMVLMFTIVLWGLPLAPALALFDFVTDATLTENDNLNYIVYGLTIGLCFMIYILSLLAMAGFTQRLIFVRFPGDKLVDDLNSWTTIRWAICGHIHRCTHPVLVHTIPSLISNAYYRLAGAKIGKGVQINTINLNDPSMVTIKDNVVVGGGCIINGHLVEKGQIILSRITLEEGSLLGARVTIQPGVTVGKGAVIGTNGLVGKYKTIPAGEVWAGLPVKCIKKSSDRI